MATYDFAYDYSNRITQIDSSIDGVSDFTFDDTHQLTDADHAGGRTDESYSYDANGNRTGGSYSTGTGNRITADGTYTYQYDNEGNRTRRTKNSDSSYEEYTFDFRNRLTKVDFKTSGGSVTKWIEYEYDAFNRMVRRTVDPDGPGGASATDQFFAGYVGIHATLEFDDDDASDVSHRYLWGIGFDTLLADEQISSVSSAGNVLWPLADYLGTIRDIADFDEGDPDFAITNHRVFDSFGRLESETNSAVDLAFGFTGKYTDADTGYTHHLNRWYDPATGRWLTDDPIGFSAGDTNLSRYVGNHPTHSTDPLGLSEFGPGNPGFAAEVTAVREQDVEFEDFQKSIRGMILESGIPSISPDLYVPDGDETDGFDFDNICA